MAKISERTENVTSNIPVGKGGSRLRVEGRVFKETELELLTLIERWSAAIWLVFVVS